MPPAFRLLFVLLLVSATGFPAAAAADRTTITILSTTDLHGNIYPIDYTTNRPAARGLAKIGTLIRQVRRTQPNLIVIDSGDTIQGTALAYYHSRRDNSPPSPIMLAMNELGFDALAIGNHEYNFGLSVLEKARSEAAFPWLSGNTYRSGSDDTAYPAYLIKELSGVRVGIIGLITPGVPQWENKENYAGLEFRDPVAAARRWVDAVRGRERADVVVIAMHMGLEEDIATGAKPPGQMPMENAALAIARNVAGIDTIFMGHTHRVVPSLWVNGILLAQAGRWGDHLIRADLHLARNPAGSWQVLAKTARSLPITSATPADPEVMALVAPYHEATQAWLDRPLGRSGRVLTAFDSRVRDNALVDLIHRVQLDAGAADVSIAASFNLAARLPAGPVTVRDIAGLYVYENTLVTVELTGAQLKEALEHSARYFRPYVAGRTAAQLIDPQIPGYNFDTAEGVDYTIDLTRAPGDRIIDLTFRGRPLSPGERLRVAVNNYRVNGGGGYTMYRDAPVLYRSATEIRDLIIDWVERHPEIPAEPTGNWRLHPE